MTPADVSEFALVPDAHRVIRTLDSGDDAVPGILVTDGDGVAVRADAASLRGWEGWRFSGADHVLGPFDLVRRGDGQDVLLPWCTERVSTFLGRRAVADHPLSSGEISTLTVSLLRGLDELGPVGVQGGWWLTDGGRPLFVFGAGEGARAGARAIIEVLKDASADKPMVRVLTGIIDGLDKAVGQPVLPALLLDGWEREVLATAAPRTLDRETYPPERARSVARAEITSLAPAARRRHLRERRAPADALSVSFVETLRHAARPFAVLGARARRLATRLPKGPKLLVAGAAAAAVLVGGLLLPTGGGEESGATADTRADSHPEASATTTAPSAPAVTDDAMASASALIAAAAACRDQGDEECAAAIAPGSAGIIPRVPAGSPALALVDEYGDVAVIRSTPEVGSGAEGADGTSTAPEQMLVLIRLDEKWLIRDVYDVADQPS